MTVREVISFFYTDPKARLGEIVVDAFIHETHSFSSEISEHPVENGSTIVDHVHNKPFSLSIDGLISNTPMGLIGLTAFDSVKRYLDGERNDFAVMAFDKIEDIFTKRQPIAIATSLRIYNDMVLENLRVERGGGKCDSLHFSCSAQQVRWAHQEFIKIPTPKVDRAKPKQKMGLQEAKPLSKDKVEEAVKNNTSLLKGGFDAGIETIKRYFGS